jgi:hypothetical protein
MRYCHGLHHYEFVKLFTEAGKQPFSTITPVKHIFISTHNVKVSYQSFPSMKKQQKYLPSNDEKNYAVCLWYILEKSVINDAHNMYITGLAFILYFHFCPILTSLFYM